MAGQQITIISNEEAEAILTRATPEQKRWVGWRILKTTDKAAAHEVGLSHFTVCHWPNKADLDKVVHYYSMCHVEAARFLLEGASDKAAETLIRELRGRQAVVAANSILDRTGVTAVRGVDLTTGGKDFEILLRAVLGEPTAGGSASAAQ